MKTYSYREIIQIFLNEIEERRSQPDPKLRKPFHVFALAGSLSSWHIRFTDTPSASSSIPHAVRLDLTGERDRLPWMPNPANVLTNQYELVSGNEVQQLDFTVGQMPWAISTVLCDPSARVRRKSWVKGQHMYFDGSSLCIALPYKLLTAHYTPDFKDVVEPWELYIERPF